MGKSTLLLATLSVLMFTSTSFVRKSEKSALEKIWYNQEKTSKIRVYKATDGKFYGKIVWLKDPIDPQTGKPRTDKENPDEKLRSTPLMNLIILRGFEPDISNASLYSGGKIYDPKNGKTYCGKISFNGNALDLRGFICSASFLGRTSTWTLAED